MFSPRVDGEISHDIRQLGNISRAQALALLSPLLEEIISSVTRPMGLRAASL